MNDLSTVADPSQVRTPANGEPLLQKSRPPGKFGAQVTLTKNGRWSVTQLVQKAEHEGYKIDKNGGVIFVRQSKPDSEAKLLITIQRALGGQIGKTGEM